MSRVTRSRPRANTRVSVLVLMLAAFAAACGGTTGEAKSPTRDAIRAVGIHATGCGPTASNASGLVIGPGLVLTAAHPVAGAETIVVRVGDAVEIPASVVAFDPWMDIAYLRADAETLHEVEHDLPIGVKADPGPDADVFVFRDFRSVRLEAEILRRVWINTEDVYVDEQTRRPGFDLAADIDVGDSGGAVVADGELIGVIWARVRDPEDRRAYAIDLTRASTLVDQQLASGELGAGVDAARCRWDPLDLSHTGE